MRTSLLLVSVFAFHQLYSQQNCVQHSHLYQFDRNGHPRHFTERLGNHPQFPFLQQENGVSSPALFIEAIQDSAKQKKYKREFDAFDALLRNSGFKNGYKDLTEERVKNVYIAPGTVGNLGFYNQQKDLISYSYVSLEPAGEGPQGVAAWKLTNHSGCFLYILHTCGNAFYPNDAPHTHGSSGGSGGSDGYGGDCCRSLSVKTQVDTAEWKSAPIQRPLHVRINFYQGKSAGSGHAGSSTGGYDTVFQLIRYIDTIVAFPYGQARQWKVYGISLSDKIMICKDSALNLFTRLLVDSSGPLVKPEDLSLIVSDTSYACEGASPVLICSKKWEIAADGGLSFNSIPPLDNTTNHSKTNGAHLAGELAISRIFNHWLQAGISAAFVMLSYQDDIGYPGSVAGIYNSVYAGNPIIPLQIFAKATTGGPLGWQSNISLSAGYSIPTNGSIENSGNTLTTKPMLKGGLTAGIKLGLAYFFNCKFGLALSAGGQYFSNKGALMNYSLWALPITAGIRYRF